MSVAEFVTPTNLVFIPGMLSLRHKYKEIPRPVIAENLPGQYTPKLALILLYKYTSPLEAVLYSDHFNDLRSCLILRFVTDQKLG